MTFMLLHYFSFTKKSLYVIRNTLYEYAARIVVEMDGGGNVGDVPLQGLRHEDTAAATAPYCWRHPLQRIAGIVRPKNIIDLF